MSSIAVNPLLQGILASVIVLVLHKTGTFTHFQKPHTTDLFTSLKPFMEPTLTAVFGANATQTATHLNIAKNDLVATGLTLADDIPAEKLIAAILKQAAIALSEENRDSNIDQSVAVSESDFPSFTTRTNGTVNSTYIRDTITVELDKPYSSTGIDPDDY